MSAAARGGGAVPKGEGSCGPGPRPGRADRSASRRATPPPNKAARWNGPPRPAAQSRRAPAPRGWAATSPPPPSSADKGGGGPEADTGGGVGVVATTALPPLRPAARGAPASGDLAVPAQPGSGSARIMGSAAALRHRRRVLIFPARRRGLSARPRCPPSPRQSRLPLGRWRGAAAPEGRKRLGRGARAATPPRRDPRVRRRRARERAAPGGAPGWAPGDRAGPGRDA